MKAALLRAYGDIDQFYLGDAADPTTRAGEVVIKVEAAGLNPVDGYVRQGFLAKMAPLEFPAILGVDAAGTIVSVGEGVAGFAVGDRVIGHLPINGHGAYAELAVVPLVGLAKLPENVGFAAGATLPLVVLTGRQAVDALGVKAGDRVLVSGALGAVGRAAVQYLKSLGALPVAAVRSSRVGEGEALAGEAVDIDAAPVAADFDFAISGAAPAALHTINHVRAGGTLASVTQLPEGANAGDRIKIINLWTQDNPAMLQAIADAAGRGEIEIPIAATFTLAQLPEAHKLLVTPQVGGKIIITP